MGGPVSETIIPVGNVVKVGNAPVLVGNERVGSSVVNEEVVVVGRSNVIPSMVVAAVG
jgi:hypothetical protein